MQDFHNLKVYQEALSLSIEIYNVSTNWQDLRLKGQLNSAVRSIFANLAEMSAFDNNTNQAMQKVKVSVGEANETESWLEYCRGVNLITEEQYQKWLAQIISIRRKLYGLISSMKKEILENKNKVVRYETDKSGFAYAKS
ncbi:MAG: four helix bundle protein [Candidatus Woesearchaeota archaeon]